MGSKGPTWVALPSPAPRSVVADSYPLQAAMASVLGAARGCIMQPASVRGSGLDSAIALC
jgi:hypothetical protein